MGLKIIGLDENPGRVEEYVDVMTLGFRQPNNGANRAIMPAGRSAENESLTVEAMRKALAEPKAPGKIFRMLIVDEDTDEAITMFCWKLNDDEYKHMTSHHQTQGTSFPTVDCNEAAMNDFFGGLDESEKEVMGTQEHWCLSVLATKPGHERRGAGKLALDWGFRRADAADLPCFIQASPTGAPLYARNGFVTVTERPFDCRKYGVDMEYVTLNMIRAPIRTEPV